MRKTESSLPRRLSPEKVRVFAFMIWQNRPSVAADVSMRASKIMQTAYEKRPIFFGGKSGKRLLSGLFYHLGPNIDNVKTQKEIARALGTNEVTIRASCQDWLDSFPEFF